MTRARDLADSADKDISGTLTVDDLTASGDVSVAGNLSVSGTTVTIDSANAQTVDLGDNDKIQLGDGDDLQIYHDGSNSYIDDQGTGRIYIRASDQLRLQASDGENYALFAANGAAQFYYDNSLKLATTATGVNVTGNITFGDSHFIGDGGGDNLEIISSSGENVVMKSSGGIFSFSDNSGNEYARLDASGNLLVGTTDAAVYDNNTGTTADNGLNLRGDGKLDAARYNAPVLGLNRTGTDGTLAEFRKNGTTVGSIGVDNSNNLFISGSATNHAGLEFDSNAIYPQRVGVASNGTVDMGANGIAFKDLYLSGGAYLGGTTSANYLEDYEEGTFTPVVVGGTQTASVVSAHYTKIGRLVTLNVYIQLSNVTNATALVIGGFPFTVDGYTATNIVNANSNDTDKTPLIRSQSNSTQAEAIYADGNQLAVTQTNLNGNFIFTLTYEQQ